MTIYDLIYIQEVQFLLLARVGRLQDCSKDSAFSANFCHYSLALVPFGLN